MNLRCHFGAADRQVIVNPLAFVKFLTSSHLLARTARMSNTTPVPIQAPNLREWILSKQSNPPSSDSSSLSIPKTFKVVDVRDDDYVGGHIPGTINVPSRQFSSRVTDLLDELKDTEAVVFTCALSQQRGPNVPFVQYSVDCRLRKSI